MSTSATLDFPILIEDINTQHTTRSRLPKKQNKKPVKKNTLRCCLSLSVGGCDSLNFNDDVQQQAYFKTPEGRYELHSKNTRSPNLLPYSYAKSISQATVAQLKVIGLSSRDIYSASLRQQLQDSGKKLVGAHHYNKEAGVPVLRGFLKGMVPLLLLMLMEICMSMRRVKKVLIKVDDSTGKIVDACFKTFGCGSAIASSSVATEWVKGKQMEEVLTIKNTKIAKHLSLPPVKLHCCMLAEDAIKAVVKDYQAKQTKKTGSTEASLTEKAVNA
ncbi:hypothetical protein ACFXTI_014218 [Malus domestica]